MMAHEDRELVISKWWVQTAIITFAAGFAVLGYLSYRLYAGQPPIPAAVVDEAGDALFGREDIMAGQHIFQRYGLMEYGTLFGHGAYLGPDFTADYLHRAEEMMVAYYEARGLKEGEAEAAVRRELKENRYDAQQDRLTFSSAQAAAWRQMVDHYALWFGAPSEQKGLRRPFIEDREEVRQLASYFAWAAWVTTAQRPGHTYSYTNNWPPDRLAGNALTADSVLWSMLSLVALLGGIGLIMFVFGRYDMLGWRRREDEEAAAQLRFREPELVRLTAGQRATPWYYLVVAGLFLMQGLLGGANAHYHVEPAGFYGIDLATWFPYNLTRMWHLQLALFFVATSYLAMGIFLAPMIAGREPKHQDKLALVLFGALVVVVVGSLLGEALSLKGMIRQEGPWYWVGAQGWEYLDLGRMWQILLTVGLLLWVVILVRGLRSRLRGEHRGSLPWLFVYSALSIPLFYGAGLVFWQRASYAIVDFWRFWVVHLWVEDFLELFTTIMVAYVFVLLGVVRLRVATTVVYLDIILYSIGGVIGTMHHLYFSGAPAIHMAFGACFSAMEVVPLVLLTYEAWRFIRLGGASGDASTMGASTARFPHKWAVMFLIAVGFWNFLGAGVFGFLINLPAVSYYEIGTQFTANHGHAAMMGVYGMLAIGFFMFVARYFVPRDRKSERAMKVSFWSLNVGLAWMVFVNLVPIGILQVYDSVGHGYWHARQAAFFDQPSVRVIEWLRLPGDVLFIVAGIGPVVYLAVRMLRYRKRPGSLPLDEATEPLTQMGES
jgi:nitric oxide reductase subunit B